MTTEPTDANALRDAVFETPNIFAVLMFPDSFDRPKATREEKVSAVTNALIFDKHQPQKENQKRLGEFEVFGEYLHSEYERLTADVADFTKPEAFYEVQDALMEINEMVAGSNGALSPFVLRTIQKRAGELLPTAATNGEHIDILQDATQGLIMIYGIMSEAAMQAAVQSINTSTTSPLAISDSVAHATWLANAVANTEEARVTLAKQAGSLKALKENNNEAIALISSLAGNNAAKEQRPAVKISRPKLQP